MNSPLLMCLQHFYSYRKIELRLEKSNVPRYLEFICSTCFVHRLLGTYIYIYIFFFTFMLRVHIDLYEVSEVCKIVREYQFKTKR